MRSLITITFLAFSLFVVVSAQAPRLTVDAIGSGEMNLPPCRGDAASDSMDLFALIRLLLKARDPLLDFTNDLSN